MTNTDRQQRMAERILEDESLRGELEDSAATALVDWASQRAARAAADPAQPDDQVEALVQQIRQAARTAALSGETEPKRLIALAEDRIAPAAGTSSASGAAPAAAEEGTHAEQPAAVRAVGQEHAAAQEAPLPATTAAEAQPAPADAAPKPDGAPPRRRRSRLARFLKRLRGGH
jgi:hypothetical protein